jgi:hypothetical protein
MLSFVFRDHAKLALHAALLFTVGAFASWPVIHYRLSAVAQLPLAVFRLVVRLLGHSPSLAHMTGVIFGFNGTVIFLYMATGCHPLLPKLFGIWTGLNVCVVSALATEEGLMEPALPAPGQWAPPPGVGALCGLLVLVLELPCFWLALAMGMSMGHAVQSGAASYGEALAVRTGAYGAVVLPLLLLSALAEAVALRGSGPREERPATPGCG